MKIAGIIILLLVLYICIRLVLCAIIIHGDMLKRKGLRK